MFGFLSLFKKTADEALAENDYDFNETPAPAIDDLGDFESKTPAVIDKAIGGAQQEHPFKQKPSIDIASQRITDQAKINNIRAELSDMTADPRPLSGDSPFLKEGPITEDEKTEKVTQFGFDMASVIPGQEVSNVQFRTEDGAATITTYFPTDVRSKLSELTPEQRGLFKVSADGKSGTYPNSDKELAGEAPSIQQNQTGLERGGGPLLVDGTKRSFPENERNAESIPSEELAEMIRTTPGDELVIYTGAGISKGQVPDMGELKNSLYVNGNTEDFLQALLDDTEALAKTFTTFQDKMNNANATPAHNAIKEIMEAKPGATLMTQNSDKIHEISNIRPIHMAALPEFYEFLKERTDKASLVVTAGLNGDDLGFLKWVTAHNPDVRIVAIDLGKTPATYPSYLNKDNFILPVMLRKHCPQLQRL